MDEPAPWEELPVEEQKMMWRDAERKFWIDYDRKHEREQAEADKQYQTACTDAKVQLGILNGRRSQLSESQARLARELAKVEEELASVTDAYNLKAEKLARLEQDYRDETQMRLEDRANLNRTMRRFFREKRGEEPDGEEENDLPVNGKAHSVAPSSQQAEEPQLNGSRREEPSTAASSVGDDMDGVEYHNGDREQETPVDTLVDVVDADGNVIGPVQRIEPWNQWVEAILELPIQRPVKIRRGRRFNQAHLATIYERTEAKGVKWLSCMIQAIGEVQSKRCQSCEKNQGAFDDCIVVGGDLFQKCGNCEWNRQGCHGSSGEVLDGTWALKKRQKHLLKEPREVREFRESEVQHLREIQPAPEPVRQSVPGTPVRHSEPPPESVHEADDEPIRDAEQPKEQQPAERPIERIVESPSERPTGRPNEPTPEASLYEARETVTLPSRPAIEPDRAQPTTETDALKESGVSEEVKYREIAPKRSPATNGSQPEQMPTPTPVEYRLTPGFTPANSRSRPPSAERRTPASLRPIEPSPQPPESLPDESLEEITKENLILKHDGEVYTYPECVAGVPLVKIDENHPYWEPSWQNVRGLIEPQLERWREKHLAAIEAGPKQEKGGSSKYQIGRQVNRGIKILEFLDEGTISPYQLLGKKYILSGKGGICSYDTLFRLSESISELSKFKLDITPVEWIRQRLYEIMQVEGLSFNLPRTIHDFYHDPKLTALRYKHGFKNIGRPSGIKGSRQSLGSAANTSTPKVPLKKRKSMHSLASTPNSFPDQSPLATSMSYPPDSPVTSHLNKRPKYITPAGVVQDEFYTDDFTDTDSWSGAELRRHDWRLYQVKTRLFTSSTEVTQYWTWFVDEQCFEHQVLKDDKPVQWGLHKDPIDFHVNLDEIAELAWNIEALKVHVVMRSNAATIAKLDGKPRGDVMAAFKRERTMRRFLNFCRDQSVVMLKGTAEELNRRWDSIQSEQLPSRRVQHSANLLE